MRRGRSWVLAAALSVCAVAGPAAAAERPATSGEALVFDHAAEHLRAVGVAVPAFRVAVADPEVCGVDPSALVEVYACAYPGVVYLTQDAAADAARYYRSARHTRRATRRTALANCGDQCAGVAMAALHELVHVTRWSVRPVWAPEDYPFEEGLAESVADDQLSPMMWRVAGLRAASPGYNYVTWVDMTRAVTAHDEFLTPRRARLVAVMTPRVLFTTEVPS